MLEKCAKKQSFLRSPGKRGIPRRTDKCAGHAARAAARRSPQKLLFKQKFFGAPGPAAQAAVLLFMLLSYSDLLPLFIIY